MQKVGFQNFNKSSDIGGGYRYFFNGQEADNEVLGEGVSLTAEFWQYDSRLGRRWNVDPVSGRLSLLVHISVCGANANMV